MNRADARVLVVDDVPENRTLLVRALALEGFEAGQVSSGRAALEAVAAGGWDAVLLDWMMPDMNGLEVLEALRADHGPASLPVLMVTALDQRRQVLEAFEAGANDYVVKPVDLAILAARLRVHLQVQRMTRAREQVLAAAGHDLRSPLAAVKAAFQLLEHTRGDAGDEDPRVRQLGAIVHRKIGALEHLLEDILEVQRSEVEGEAQVAELATACREAVAGLQARIEAKDQVLEVEGEDVQVLVRGGESALRRVVDNLLSNASKFSPVGGRLAIGWGPGPIGGRLWVEDSGPGVPAEERDRLFQPFTRLSAQPTAGESSTGLGLSICQRLVDSSGGQVLVDESPLGGARFEVALPTPRSGRVLDGDPEVLDQHPGAIQGDRDLEP